MRSKSCSTFCAYKLKPRVLRIHRVYILGMWFLWMLFTFRRTSANCNFRIFIAQKLLLLEKTFCGLKFAFEASEIFPYEFHSIKSYYEMMLGSMSLNEDISNLGVLFNRSVLVATMRIRCILKIKWMHGWNGLSFVLWPRLTTFGHSYGVFAHHLPLYWSRLGSLKCKLDGRNERSTKKLVWVFG